jgi:transcriptional regulator GlxA family with amidase domain
VFDPSPARGEMAPSAVMAHSRHPEGMSSATRRVSMVVYPDVQILDVTGPLEVFARTARWLMDQRGRREPAYRVELLAARRGPLRSSSGLELVVHHSFMEVRGGIDTLLVAKRYTPARAAACPRGRARRGESLPGPRPS